MSYPWCSEHNYPGSCPKCADGAGADASITDAVRIEMAAQMLVELIEGMFEFMSTLPRDRVSRAGQAILNTFGHEVIFANGIKPWVKCSVDVYRGWLLDDRWNVFQAGYDIGVLARTIFDHNRENS